MNQRLAGLNTDIVIATKKSALSTITPDFFNAAGITDGEMELADQPYGNNNFVRIEYKNGISVTGEANNRVIFSQPIDDTNGKSPLITDMVCKYTHLLANLEYSALGINFRGYVSFSEEQEARRYIAANFLAGGAWQEIGAEPMRASLNLVFQLERAPLYLSIAEAAIRLQDETTTPIVMFSGSFSYILNSETAAEKLAYLHECIGNWQADFLDFTDIINNKFLAKIAESTLVVPTHSTVTDVFAMSAAAIS